MIFKRWIFIGIVSMAGVALLASAAAVATSDKAKGLDVSKSAPPEPKTVQAAASLPIAQVLLYTSGVGYFQREGAVVGDTRVDLTFPIGDVNDLLKSMVVQDLSGGLISSVSYDSIAPLDKMLNSFAVNLSHNPTLAEILNQARGEKIEVVVAQSSATQPGTFTGTLVGLETKLSSVKDVMAMVEILNVWCADGVRAFRLSEVQRIRFLNPILEEEVRKALNTLALSHDAQKKAVSINFSGAGKRDVRVGYVVENPIWKTSYRLVLDKTNKSAPNLQGWAVVENPTDEDWKEVRMALISGRPISFQMDLYNPLYVDRPVVEPELFASLRPATYSGLIETSINPNDPNDPGGRPATMRGGLGGIGGGGLGGGLAGLGGGLAGIGAGLGGGLSGSRGQSMSGTTGVQWKLDEKLKLGEGVESIAKATKLGDYYQYRIDRPVTLQRQKSAMLPIVSKDVEATRVSIYNEQIQAKFPLLGLRFKNTSGLHLMQGPITLFEGSSYAGDARILDLQPNEERLLSYAIDLGTEVKPAPGKTDGHYIEIKVVKGVIWTKNKIRESRSYTIVNRNDQERTILIEHPVREKFSLVDCKADETAADVYRFQVKVAPGKTVAKTITEERIIDEAVNITTLNNDYVASFANHIQASAKVKEGLKRVLKMREDVDQTTKEIAERLGQLRAIDEDQARLRANLKEMPVTAAAYKRYLEKFDSQEVEIEKLQAQIKKLQQVQRSQRKEFDEFVANFSAE